MKITHPKVSDVTSQLNMHVIGQHPVIAMGCYMLSTSNALSQLTHNATMAQQQGNSMMQAATIQGVNAIFSCGKASVNK
ncbi:RebB family R body protein [Photobacterium leiognathi]|uniref:RebB family R body protein n=1 Tax=Photobacterium leiognathi TaxID=553611 RepID=UPI002981E837|nr:RebB family R body protein [Photobacterium leiognathi]